MLPCRPELTEIYLRSIQNTITNTAVRRSRNFLSAPQTTLIFLLALHRTSSHWTTTGVKHAGAPSIASDFLPAHPYLLWTLVACTYFYAGIRFSCCFPNHFVDDGSRTKVFSSPSLSSPQRVAEILGAPGGLGHALLLGVVGLTFKVEFTTAEAPELMEGMGWMRWMVGLLVKGAGGLNLVTQAQVVFGCLGIAGFGVGWAERTTKKQQKWTGGGKTSCSPNQLFYAERGLIDANLGFRSYMPREALAATSHALPDYPISRAEYPVVYHF